MTEPGSRSWSASTPARSSSPSGWGDVPAQARLDLQLACDKPAGALWIWRKTPAGHVVCAKSGMVEADLSRNDRRRGPRSPRAPVDADSGRRGQWSTRTVVDADRGRGGQRSLRPQAREDESAAPPE